MNYISTRNTSEKISFKEAVINGLALDGGLYMPEKWPTIEMSFFDQIESLDDQEIAYRVMAPYIGDSLTEAQLKWVIEETLCFKIPVVSLNSNTSVLELFHGPTQAFKDVGARFMSRCLSCFQTTKSQDVTVLVATSGDTGSAVAHGFYKVPGVQVKILFPKGKVSPYQEYQMCSLGENIQAFEVDGRFDDCQALVKKAFQDQALNEKLQLSSANSINVARFLPQMLYYFFAYKQLKKEIGNRKWIISVPSGNFGNLTAGLFAKKMGLPINRFIASCNANDTFYQYIQTGKYKPKASVQTISNAMDVGAPSNFERILHLYNQDHQQIYSQISAYRFSDDETLQKIKETFKREDYLLDPHGAVGLLGLEKELDSDCHGLFLETAHPQKFSEIIQRVIPGYASEKVDLSKCQKTSMVNDYDSFRNSLLV